MSDIVDIDYIKKMFCKFKCNIQGKTIEVQVEDRIYCNKCGEYSFSCFDTETNLEKEDLCKVCQIDNFIRDLQDNNIIMKGDI